VDRGNDHGQGYQFSVFRNSIDNLGACGYPVPAQEFGLPHGRPTGLKCPVLDGVSTFHMRKTRSGRVPSIPRGGGVPTTM